MEVKTDTDKSRLLESLLNDARAEADDLRRRLNHCERIIKSTRLVMAHELKKPVIAISGYVDLICEEMEIRENESALRYARKARHECELLNNLNVFYLTLLENAINKPKLGMTTVDVGRCIREVVDMFPEEFEAGKRLTIRVPDKPVKIEMNGNAMQLILRNIIENALQYSEGSVSVELEQTPDKRSVEARDVAKIRVSDAGVGIPRGQLDRIFNPFVRLHEDMAPGTGLGLTIVRSLVELNGGDVFVRSQKGEGTTIYVTLPVTVPDEQMIT